MIGETRAIDLQAFPAIGQRRLLSAIGRAIGEEAAYTERALLRRVAGEPGAAPGFLQAYEQDTRGE